MGRYEYEKLTLLPTSSNSSNSTIQPSSSSSSFDGFSDHEDSKEFQQKTKHFRTKIAGAIRLNSTAFATNNRCKLHLNRGLSKRLARLLIFAFMVPMMLFLTFYSSLFSGASRRHCKYINHYV